MLNKNLFAGIICIVILLPQLAYAADFKSNFRTLPSPTPIRERIMPTAAPERMNTLPTSAPTPTTTLHINTLRTVTTPTTTQRLRVIPTQIPTAIPTETEQRRAIPTPSVIPTNTNFSPIITTTSLPFGEITESNTATREGRPVYTFTAREKLKLFGFIPLNSIVNFEVDQENHAIRKTFRPWWSMLTVKPDWNQFFAAIGPNLTITDVAWDKKSYHAGDMSNISFKIKNTGNEQYNGVFDIVWRDGEKPLGYYKNFYTYLKPGESTEFKSFAPQPYVCDKTILLEIDETNKVKETNKKDNVWQGVSQCAPTSGPDLAVTQIKLENPFFPSAEKRVGAKNTVKYTIQNVSDGVSVKTRALMKTASGQYLALIDVPPLPPFLVQTGEVHYTPNDCSPIQLDIDTENKNTEPDENNNFAIEPPEITDHCNKGPDLSFGLHYYTSKDGYSFGKPHQNGEALSFQVEIVNSATDQTWGCAKNVTIGVYEDDNLYTTFNEGNLGFGPSCPNGGGTSGSYDHPTKVKTQKFIYPAKCGATLKLVIDPNVALAEIDKSNNTWSQLIECQP